MMLEKFIRDGMAHHGFSVIEVVANCHTQYGRRNKIGEAWDLMKYIKESSVGLKQAEKMTPEQLQGKILNGKFYENNDRPEYTDQVKKLIARFQK
jgi:2-oxoglutarate ferredoxin oxidoreductase subunit beta